MGIRRYIYEKLKSSDVPASELTAETNFILEKFLKVKNIYAQNDVCNYDLDKLNFIFEKRKQKYPLQYIFNIADFMGREFYVDEDVLIPRPETELLVIKCIEKMKKIEQEKIAVLDIGTGSGCIPIILSLNFKNCDITSCDISSKALEVAKKNTFNLNASVDFIQSDLFENIVGEFDIIVSNPPYIPPQKEKNIQPEVTFEPLSALYTTDDLGIEYYEKIIANAKKHLKKNGYLLFELGINQSDLVKELFLNYNYSDIEILKDFDNIDRVICARIK